MKAQPSVVALMSVVVYPSSGGGADCAGPCVAAVEEFDKHLTTALETFAGALAVRHTIDVT